MEIENIDFTSNSLALIVQHIKEELELGYINSIQNIDFETIKLKIHRKETKQLVVNTKFLYIPKYNITAMDNSTAFIKFLKKKLDNQRIQEIKQHKNNKLIYLKLDSYYLIFEFFSKSNIILTDLNFKVLSARRYEHWKNRDIIRNETYSFPESNYFLDIKKEEFIEKYKNLDKKTIISNIIKEFNIAPIYLNNIFEKNNIEDELVLDIKKIELVYENIKELFSLKDYNLKLVSNTKNKNNKSLIISKDIEDIIDINDLEKLVVNSKIQAEQNPITKKKKKIDTIITIQKKSKEEFLEKIEDYKKQGELIYSYFTIIEEVNKQIDIATDKKIDNKEICSKINTYFKNKNYNLSINNINLKTKTYDLKVD